MTTLYNNAKILIASTALYALSSCSQNTNNSTQSSPLATQVSTSEDIRIELNQSFATKLIDGIKWPVTIDADEKSLSRNLLSKGAPPLPNEGRELTLKEINSLAQDIQSERQDQKVLLADEFEADRSVLSKAFAEAIADTEKVISGLRSGRSSNSEVSLEDAEIALRVLKGEASLTQVSALSSRGFCLGLDFKVKRTRILVDRPTVNIGNGKFSFDMPRVSVKVWIDVILEYPGLCCSDRWCGCFCPKFCCKKKSWELRPSASFRAKGYAFPESTSNSVLVKGHFSRLRFQHPLLGWIPLESFVNKSLEKEPLEEIPYKDFQQSFPSVGADVGIDYVRFFSVPNKLPMSATIKVSS